MHPELPRSRTEPCGPSLLTQSVRGPVSHSTPCTVEEQQAAWGELRGINSVLAALVAHEDLASLLPGLQCHSITVHFFPPKPKQQLYYSSHPEQCWGHWLLSKCLQHLQDRHLPGGLCSKLSPVSSPWQLGCSAAQPPWPGGKPGIFCSTGFFIYMLSR